MTWKQLIRKAAKLSKEQMDSTVCFQMDSTVCFEDNYDGLMEVNFYINDDDPKENEDWGTEVGAKMPYLGL